MSWLQERCSGQLLELAVQEHYDILINGDQGIRILDILWDIDHFL